MTEQEQIEEMAKLIDGSVDVEKITEELKEEPIYIIRYRQGARIPEVIEK